MSNNIEVIWELKSEDIIRDMISLRDKHKIGEFRAIELYGGDGHTLSSKMAKQSKSFIGYDIDPAKEKEFRKNIANGEFCCRDSVKMMMDLEDGELGSFNLVGTDSPMCIYGDNYCEHFQIINYIYKLFGKGEKILYVFPVIVKPYNTDKKENREWLIRREEFYRTREDNLDLEKTLSIYDELFEKQNLKILERGYTCREYRNGIDWLYEFMYVLEKK